MINGFPPINNPIHYFDAVHESQNSCIRDICKMAPCFGIALPPIKRAFPTKDGRQSMIGFTGSDFNKVRKEEKNR